MPQSREERLRKKREAERRRYERLKNDEEGRKRLKEKEAFQYEQKKKKGISVSIKQLSERDQRAKRKKWRTQKKEYRQKKKLEQERQQALVTPPTSEDEEELDRNAQKIEKQRRALSKLRKTKSREIKKKNELITKLQQKMEKYKKKYHREKNKNSQVNNETNNNTTAATPRTRVRRLMGKKNNTKEIAKKVLFAECVADQLENSYNEIETQEEQRKFKQQVCGNIMRKYRLHSQYKRKLRGKNGKGENDSGPKFHKRKYRNSHYKLKNRVSEFYLEEANSRVMPGKKDFVSKGKVKMQKRYLNYSMKKLHSEFLKNNPETSISYTLFCKLKPFNVKKMNASARETCKCLKCTNMELKAITLHRIGRLEKPTLECLVRNFGNESNETNYRVVVWEDPPFEEITNVKYYKWTNMKEKIIIKTTGKEKTVKNIAKIPFVCTLEEFIELLQKEIPIFLTHNNTKNHQYCEIKKLKCSLKPNESLIHMDFSENYMTKYSEEVQSFHFGGSRKQVSLHTVVAYVKDGESSVKNINFCTVSENLRHDVPAIWAHLHPVLTFLNNNYNLDTLHFLSDSPSTQYRNKVMFYFLGNVLKSIYPTITAFTWNYLEAGHGKGAPDGIGGVCKRTADRIVGEGNDINTSQQLIHVLKENVKGVNFFYIEDKDIDTVAKKIDSTKVKAFPGTMQVHQVSSVDSALTHLNFRTLSYFGVHPPPQCREIGSLMYGMNRKSYYDIIYSDSDEDGNVEMMNENQKEDISVENVGCEERDRVENVGCEERDILENCGCEERDRVENSGIEERDRLENGGCEKRDRVENDECEKDESDDEVLYTLYEAFKINKK